MALVSGCIAPHNPVFIPTVGKEQIREVEMSVQGYLQLTQLVAAQGIEVIVVLSPHAQMHMDGISLVTPTETASVSGDMAEFGAAELELRYPQDTALTAKIGKAFLDSTCPVYEIEGGRLDYGTLVPLYYLTQKLPEVSVVSVGVGFMGGERQYNLGKVLGDVCRDHAKKVCIVASGELSARLGKDSPAGYHPDGKAFDKKLLKYLQEGNLEGVAYIDPFMLEEAAQDIHKPLSFLLGAMDGEDVKFNQYSYESPYGVGLLVGSFTVS